MIVVEKITVEVKPFKKSKCRDTLAHSDDSHKKEVTVVDALTKNIEILAVEGALV